MIKPSAHNGFFCHSIFADLWGCVVKRDIWWTLSFYDIKARYRRTLIGPFWLTLGTAVTVFGMAFVGGALFSTSITDLLPYVATGLVFWVYIASFLNEGCFTFILQASLIRNTRTPFFVYVMTFVSKNLIILFHNFFVIIFAFILCGKTLNPEIFWFIPGFILLVLNSFWVSVVLGIFGARYRDVSSIVSNLTTLIMLVTPIMWKADMLEGKRQFIAFLNPFTHVINIVRDPLLGSPPSLISYGVTGGLCVVGFSVALFLYKKYAHRIVFWI